MDFKYEKELLALLTPTFDELGFKAQADSIFLKDDYAVKVDYENDQLQLLGGKPQEGQQLSFVTLSTYLFDDTHTERDLKAVSIDFEETLRAELGAKKQRAASKVAMPGRAAAGEAPTIESFTKVFLDIFPEHRDAYKQMMVEKECFLYVNFYVKHGIPSFRGLVEDKTAAKRLGKFLNFLNKHYTEGDKIVSAVVTTVFFGGTFYNDRKTFDEVVMPKMDNMTYLRQAAISSIEKAAKSKDLQAVFNK